MKTKIGFYSLVLLALLTSCSSSNSEQSNSNASSGFDIPVEQQIIWTDCLSQEEEDYLVFFYSETCNHCHEIMGDVIAFSEENIIKIYFSDVAKGETKIPISRDVDDTLGIDDINSFFIAGTPTLIEVYEGTVTANVPGKDACLSFLNEQRINNEK